MDGDGRDDARSRVLRNALGDPTKPRRRLNDPQGVPPRTLVLWALGGPIVAGYGIGTILVQPAGLYAWGAGGLAALAGTTLMVSFTRYLRRPATVKRIRLVQSRGVED